MEYDAAKIEEAMLALLGALEFDDGRVWKRYDFDIMERLHAQRYISSPRGRQARSSIAAEDTAVSMSNRVRYE